MRVLILGADGQVGFELCGAVGCVASVVAATEAQFDMTDFSATRQFILDAQPDIIINAAAYTDVDGAEKDPLRAHQVNADAVASLAIIARQQRVALIHYSTDFVFDGAKPAPYAESDAPNPINAYGRSKLAGEEALTSEDAAALILRTAWVYSTRRKSFVSTILRLASEREELKVVSDQVGNPTFSRDLAIATAMLVYELRLSPYEQALDARGIYHVTNTGSCSRFELAQAAVDLDPNKNIHRLRSLLPVSSDQFPLPAARPLNTPLSCSKLRDRFGIELPPWTDALKRALQS